MIQRTPEHFTVPLPRSSEEHEAAPIRDRRPRFLRWLLPTACASSAPLDHQQQAELKLIAYH